MARSLGRLCLFGACILLAGAASGCAGGKLGAPKSDQNFDDGDDPGQPMPGTLPDAAADAIVPDGSGAACTKPADCAAPLRCVFPIALGCGTKGSCVLYTDPTGCAQKQACACDGTTVSLCSPDGYGPAPIDHAGACPQPPGDAAPE